MRFCENFADDSFAALALIRQDFMRGAPLSPDHPGIIYNQLGKLAVPSNNARIMLLRYSWNYENVNNYMLDPTYLTRF